MADLLKCLILEDDPLVGLALEKVVAPILPVLLARDLQTARKVLREEPIAAVTIDLLLEGGECGLDLLDDVRKLKPPVPILAISGLLEPSVLNWVARERICLVVKPFDDPSPILEFVEFAAEQAGSGGQRRLVRMIDDLAAQWGLTPTQRLTLEVGVDCSGDKATVGSLLGRGPATVKSHVQAILDKSGEPSFRGLCRRLRTMPPV